MRIKVLMACMDQEWARRVRDALSAAMTPEAGGDAATPVWVDASAHPDVILMDSDAGADGTRERIARAAGSAGSGVLVAFERCTRDLLVEALEGGARGCMLKDTPVPVLRQALGAVHRGESWFSNAVLLQALRVAVPAAPAPAAAEHELTPREHEILHLIGEGMTNKEIGRRLAISDHTVKTHLHRVYVKLNRSGRYKAFLAQPGAGGHLPDRSRGDARNGRSGEHAAHLPVIVDARSIDAH